MPATPLQTVPSQTEGRDAADRLLAALAGGDAAAATREFYAALRREVIGGEAGLAADEMALLREHYAVMMRPERFPPRLVSTIYVERRSPAVAAILAADQPKVFDAGCGFGSECFLFAATGARVLAVDREPRRIAVGKKRQAYYEDLLARDLDITWAAADLDGYETPERGLSLTWMASVLANVGDQESFLARLHAATRPGGRVMLTDMNLLNPLFALQEWRRRCRARQSSPEFARRASFRDMFFRRHRRGARYFPAAGGELFDDAQFFWSQTLALLFRRAGFEPDKPRYSGLAPPIVGAPGLHRLETFLAKIPLLRSGGYFYLMSGVKPVGG